MEMGIFGMLEDKHHREEERREHTTFFLLAIIRMIWKLKIHLKNVHDFIVALRHVHHPAECLWIAYISILLLFSITLHD